MAEVDEVVRRGGPLALAETAEVSPAATPSATGGGAAARPVGLADTQAAGEGLGGAGPKGHVLEDMSSETFALRATQGVDAEEAAATERGSVELGTQGTLVSGDRGPYARPALDDPDARRRRAAIKARLFGGPEAAVTIGRFQLLGRLGAGGMGVVYAAYDERLDRKVAIKVLRPEIAGGQSKIRLLREAQAMARLTHPNIVGVHEVGEDDDAVFVAMEFVRGQSLDVWLADPRPWREVVDVFLQAGRGLEGAHAAGLIHRDFKPANAILGDDGVVKVLDFGLARIGDDDDAPAEAVGASLMGLRLTRSGAMLGTPAYMSPEQLLGRPLSAASDQFSFFVALYEGLYGRLPFTGATLPELCASVTTGRPADPPARRDVPPWVHRVLLRGLARDPAGRFPGMREALAALARDPARRRRRIAAILGLTLASAGASAAAVDAALPAIETCVGLGDEAAALHSDDRRAAARAAFTASAGPLGADTWARIEPRLGAALDAWSGRRQGLCEARRDGRISDALHDRSVACLERQLARITGLVDAFAVADARTVEQAPAAIAALPPLARCVDPEFLLAEVPPPEDPDARARAARGRAALERARAAIDLGDHDGAIARAAAVADEARAIGYEPLLALSEVVRGDALHWKRDGEGAEAALTSGLELGLASGDDRAAAEAIALRIFVRAEVTGEPQQALADASIARALGRRVGDHGRLAWLLATNVAVAHRRDGDLEAAERGFTEALEIAEGLGDGDGGSIEAVYTLYNLGLLAGERGDLDQAMERLRGAVEIAGRVFGPAHPSLVPILAGEVNAAEQRGRFDDALAAIARARSIAAGAPSPNPALLVPLLEVEARIAVLRRAPDAAAKVDEAEALAAEAFGAGSPRARFTLLRALLHRPARDDEEVRAVEVLMAIGPELWAEGLGYRAHALLLAGDPARAIAALVDAKGREAWSSLPPAARVSLGLLEAAALVDLDRSTDAGLALDAIEGLGGGPAVTRRIAYLRGRIAAAQGDDRAAIPRLRAALVGYAADYADRDPELLEVRVALARALRGAGERGEADEIARAALADYRALGPGFAAEAAAIEGSLGAP